MQSIPTSTCLLTMSAMAGVTWAAMTAGSVISALASRPGMSSHPLGDGSRPTCEVLIRVMLLCMFPPPGEGIVPGNGSTSRDHWPLDVGWILVLSQTLVNDLTKQVVAGPRQVFDLDHKLGTNPVHAAEHERRAKPVRARRRHFQRHLRSSERLPPPPKPSELRLANS